MQTSSVVLSSTLCRDEYPNNHGCSFTNQLNRPLDFTKGKWGVCLSEIVYEPDFWQNIRKSFASVRIQIGNFKTTEYSGVIGTHFKSFLISIVDGPIVDHTKPLKLKIRCILYSNDSRLDSPHEFEASKENALDLFGRPLDWKPYTLYPFEPLYGAITIPKDVYDIIETGTLPIGSLYKDNNRYRIAYLRYLKPNTVQESLVESRLAFEDAYYETPQTFATFLKDRVSARVYKMLLDNHATPWYLTQPQYPFVNFEVEAGKMLIFQPDGMAKHNFIVKLVFTNQLEYMLGFVPYPHQPFGDMSVGKRGSLVGGYDANMNHHPLSTLWVFTDIVKHSYVKDITLPLLRCVALDKQHSHQQSYESSSYIQYIPLAQGTINSIRIWISPDYNAESLYTQTKTHVRLEFMQIE